VSKLKYALRGSHKRIDLLKYTADLHVLLIGPSGKLVNQESLVV